MEGSNGLVLYVQAKWTSVDGLLLYFPLAYDIWSMVFGMFGLDMKVWGIILWIFGALCLMHYVASVERTQYLHI